MKTYKILFISLFFSIGGSLVSQDLTGVKIHINPGHGGYDSDDRGISTPLIEAKEYQGFWESQSNLDKGLQLRDMLESLGCTVQMSRTMNRPTQKEGNKVIFTDDTPLEEIVQMANEFGADFMLSIHSNAGAGSANYVLQLYAGKDLDDTNIYKDEPPFSDKSRDISTEIAKNQIKNQLTYWTSKNYSVRGDKTYARIHMGWSNGYGVLRKLKVPGVISEGSMHDYIPETYRLLNMEYKWMEAWNFKKAFCTYFKGAEIPTGNIAGWVKDSRNLLLDGTYPKYAKDRLLPLDGAQVSIKGTAKTYTVDDMRNGVYLFKDLEPGEYTVVASKEGYHTQEQSVTVLKNEIAYFNFELNKVRNTPPEVIDYTPKIVEGEEVDCSTNIVFVFNWDMDEESTRSAFSIEPLVEGNITFEDSQYRMRFKPSMPLEPSTVYTVKLDKSAGHPDNKTMEEDFVLSFKTNNRDRLAVLETFPEAGADNVGEQPLFWFIFDRELASGNFDDVFSIQDAEGKKLDIIDFRSGKTNKAPKPYGSYSFSLINSLEVGKEYKIVIGADLTDKVDIRLMDPLEVPFVVSGVQTAVGEVVEDFEYFASKETETKYIPNKEASTNVSTITVSKNEKTKLFDKYSACLKARFTAEEGTAVYELENMEQGLLVPDTKVFGLHVYGDMSGNELQLQFSAGADVRYMKLCDLDFGGWEFVEMKYVNPNPDGTQYKLTGFRIVRNADKVMSAYTEIYLDNLLSYDELVNSLGETPDASLVVYPNPATDRIFVSTQMNEPVALQLYSLSGQLLKEVQAREINVGGMNRGTYILKITVGQKAFAQPVMIR